MTSVPIREYLNSHHIWWIPIHLSIGANGKKGAPRVPDGFDPSKFIHFPDSLTQEEVIEIQKHADDCEHIGIDTRSTHQFDVDVMKDPVPDMKENLPYFLSSSKKLPHFFFTSPTKPTQKRSYFDGDKDLELLTGQWSYARLDAVVYNAEMPLGEINLNEGNKRKRETTEIAVVAEDPDKMKFYQKQIQTLVPNHSKTQVKKVFEKCGSTIITTNGLWCANIGRAHRSNHVWFKVKDGCLVQKCTDCRDYESVPYPMSETAETSQKDLSDREALDWVVQKFPDFLKMNKKSKMVYDPETGQWTTDSYGAFVRLVYKTWLPTETKYASQATAISAMWALFVSLPNEADFFEKAKSDTKGKLLFLDGIWDKITDTRLDFSPNLYFVFSVPHTIPTTRPDYVDLVDNFHFLQPYPEEGVADWLRQDLMKALFGLGSDTMTIETGVGANGKTERANAVMEAMGDYVGTLSGDHITKNNNPNPNCANPQLIPLRDKRLMYVSEPAKGMVVDMSLMKKITGHDKISCRDLHAGIAEFRSPSKIHFNSNGVPKFSECEASFMERRMRQLDSNTRYLDVAEDDIENQIYKRNDAFVTKMIDSCDAFIWLMIHEPLRDIAVPISIQLSSRETIEDQDDVKKLFLETFERMEGGKVFSKDICDVLGVSPKFLATRMVVWGYGKSKPIRIELAQANGYTGIRRRCFTGM